MLVPQQDGYPCSPHCAGYLRELEQRKEIERLRGLVSEVLSEVDLINPSWVARAKAAIGVQQDKP